MPYMKRPEGPIPKDSAGNEMKWHHHQHVFESKMLPEWRFPGEELFYVFHGRPAACPPKDYYGELMEWDFTEGVWRSKQDNSFIQEVRGARAIKRKGKDELSLEENATRTIQLYERRIARYETGKIKKTAAELQEVKDTLDFLYRLRHAKNWPLIIIHSDVLDGRDVCDRTVDERTKEETQWYNDRRASQRHHKTLAKGGSLNAKQTARMLRTEAKIQAKFYDRISVVLRNNLSNDVSKADGFYEHALENFIDTLPFLDNIPTVDNLNVSPNSRSYASSDESVHDERDVQYYR